MYHGKNQRASKRMRRYTYAFVTFADRTVHQCRVFDLSERGVRLIIGPVFEIPQEVGIALVPNGEPRPATVMWCKRGMAGIEYND
jgi:hypothetical protein